MTIKQVFFCAALLFTSASFAQQSQTARVTTKDVPQNAQTLEMAGNLVKYGYQTKTALPLIQAVQIFQKLNVVDATDSLNQYNRFSDAQLLSDATKFADGNKNLLTLIKETEKTTRAAKHDFPIRRYFKEIMPNETVTYHLYIDKEQYVQLVLDGLGEGVFSRSNGNLSSNLKLKAFDRNGKVLASDDSRGENCYVTFLSHTDYISITVQNAGQVTDNYVLYVYTIKISD